MKKSFLVAGFVAAMLCACSSNNQTATDNATTQESCCGDAYGPVELLAQADSLVDDTVWVKGTANHVCCCSKKKLMLGDETDTTAAPLRIMAGGEIDTFSAALVGQHVKLQGVLRLHKITKEDLENQLHMLDSMIAAAPKADEAKEEKAEEKKGCHMGGLDAKKQKVTEKLQTLKDSQQEFIADYYVEAVKFADCCKSKNSATAAPAEGSEKPSCCSGK